jgi:3-oxoacyl-[acyl-carrier-protein] synthase II
VLPRQQGDGAPGLLGPADLVAAPPAGDVRPDTFDPAAVVGRRGLRYKDDATRLALAAVHLALGDAGLLADDGTLSGSGHSVAVVVSSNFGNLDTVCAAAGTIARDSVVGLSPMGLPNASSNVIASSLAIWFGLSGPNLMVCNGGASGLDAVHWAAVLIGCGRADRAVVVGVEVDNEVVRRLLDEGPAAGSRSAGRIFHGAVAVVLESPASAAGRGAVTQSQIAGYWRGADVPGSAGAALAAYPVPGLWLIPRRSADRTPAALAAVPTVDLSARAGRSSGALGVLQCAAAIGWMDSGRGQTVLATSGSGADGGCASVVLIAARTGA